VGNGETGKRGNETATLGSYYDTSSEL